MVSRCPILRVSCAAGQPSPRFTLVGCVFLPFRDGVLSPGPPSSRGHSANPSSRGLTSLRGLCRAPRRRLASCERHLVVNATLLPRDLGGAASSADWRPFPGAPSPAPLPPCGPTPKGSGLMGRQPPGPCYLLCTQDVPGGRRPSMVFPKPKALSRWARSEKSKASNCTPALGASTLH